MKKNTFVLLSLFSLILFACETEKIESEPNSTVEKSHQFDYSVFNNRQELFDILNDTNKSSEINEKENFEGVVENINSRFNTNIPVTDFDLHLIENKNGNLDYYFQQGFITKTDYTLLKHFFADLEVLNFEESIQRLESEILELNLDTQDFKKYNDFLNTLMIVDDFYKQKGIHLFENVANRSMNKEMSPGCAVAIAANGVSTLGLTSCIVPGPNCALAVVGKGLSLLGMYYSC